MAAQCIRNLTYPAQRSEIKREVGNKLQSQSIGNKHANSVRRAAGEHVQDGASSE
jgi:hypothetical protein